MENNVLTKEAFQILNQILKNEFNTQHVIVMGAVELPDETFIHDDSACIVYDFRKNKPSEIVGLDKYLLELDNYLVKVSYRKHDVHAVGVDEIDVVSFKRYKEMTEINHFTNVKIVSLEISENELEKYHFLQEIKNEFEL